jgi:Iron-containing redox enzyme
MEAIKRTEAESRLDIGPVAQTGWQPGGQAGGAVEAYDQRALHLTLSAFNRSRLEPALPAADWEAGLWHAGAAALAEGRFLEAERQKVRSLAAEAPIDPAGFVEWLEGLKQSGPGQFDPLFDFLANGASREQMRWFVKQEVAGEAGFDDLVALAQIKMPERAKLELARNYWDEMGRGRSAAMHGPMLSTLAEALAIDELPDQLLVWEALAVGNVLVGLAYNRRYAFHALGALGAVELTAPTRAVRVAEGLERIGVSGKAVHYFRLHATIDLVHWRDWRDEVVLPLISERPEVMVSIAEGALMRLNAGARSFDRYRAHFGLLGRRAAVL